MYFGLDRLLGLDAVEGGSRAFRQDGNFIENLARAVSIVGRLPGLREAKLEGHDAFHQGRRRCNLDVKLARIQLRPLNERIREVRQFVTTFCEGYSTGALPNYVDFGCSGSSWSELTEISCRRHPSRNYICGSCHDICAHLPFKTIISLSSTTRSCLSHDLILSSIASRDGGEEFLMDPSMITGLYDKCLGPATIFVACTGDGVPGSACSSRGVSVTSANFISFAYSIDQSDLELMRRLKFMHSNTFDCETIERGIRILADRMKVSTSRGRPFVMRGTVDRFREVLDINLPLEKYIVFESSDLFGVSRHVRQIETYHGS
mmetsp:Transcript_37909/g.113282  ORF Transcript_37909/g.113282 Transcript_37909/m.113282 type:complete len:319 (-) Transcript_37909:554-1510(-)